MRCAASLSLDGADANVVAEAAPAIAEAAHILFRQTPPGDRSPAKVAKDGAAQDVSLVRRNTFNSRPKTGRVVNSLSIFYYHA